MSTEALALADNLSTAALLRDAIGVLRARGLAIDTFALDPGDGTPADQWPVCAVGAIAVADGGKPHQYKDPRITRALLAINRCFPMLAVDEDDVLVHDALAKELMLAIGRWNDSVADVEEIIEVFECTAAALDAAEAPGIPPL